MMYWRDQSFDELNDLDLLNVDYFEKNLIENHFQYIKNLVEGKDITGLVLLEGVNDPYENDKKD